MQTGLKFIGANIRSFRQSHNRPPAQLSPPKVIHDLSQVLDIPTNILFAKNTSQARPTKYFAATLKEKNRFITWSRNSKLVKI